MVWRDDATGADAPATDRLFGIFTGRTDKDYRNMGLLWDVLQVLSGARGSRSWPTRSSSGCGHCCGPTVSGCS